MTPVLLQQVFKIIPVGSSGSDACKSFVFDKTKAQKGI